MATKTLKVNVTITISTIQSSHPSAGPNKIWSKINVQPFFTKPVTATLTNKLMTKTQAASCKIRLKAD